MISPRQPSTRNKMPFTGGDDQAIESEQVKQPVSEPRAERIPQLIPL